MSLGDAFINIHADTAPFKAELATQVQAALAEAEAASAGVRVGGAAGAGTTTTNTIRTVTDTSAAAAAAKAQTALLQQEVRDHIANLDVEAAAERDFEAVRVAEAQVATQALKDLRASLLATVEEEANQEKSIAAETASIEIQYRQAVAAAAKSAYAEIQATVESEAIQERAVAAETAAIETQYRQAVAAAAKEAYAEIQATVDSEAIAERAADAETVTAFKAAQTEKVAAAKAANTAIAEGAAGAAKVTDAATAAAKVAVLGVGLTSVAVAGVAVKQAFDLQLSVQKVINLSSGQLGLSAKQISDQVISTSLATGVAANDVAGAFYKIAAAGKPAAEAADILNASAKSAAIGLGTATSVADELVAAINVYGDANLSAAKAANIFLATTQNSKFGPDELGTSIGRILPLAHDLGLSLQDLGGSLAALSHAGFSADQSVTGLQAVSSNLIKATASTGGARKEFDALHLSAQNLITDAGTHGLVAALQEINTALHASGDAAHNTQAQYQDLANNLGISVSAAIKQFSHFDLTQLQKIFPNRKALITFLGLTDDQNTAAQQAYQNILTVQPGTLDKAFLGFKGSVAGKISIGINSIKDDIIGLGNALLPTVASVVQKIQDVIAQAKDPNSDLHKFLVTLGQDLKDLGTIAVPVLKGIGGAVVTLIQDLKPVLDALASFSKTTVGKTFFEIAGALVVFASGIKLLAGAAAVINGIAAAVTALAGAEGAAAIGTALGPGGVLVAGAVAIGAAYVGTKAILDHFWPSVVTTAQKVDTLAAALAPAVTALNKVDPASSQAAAGLQHIASQATGLLTNMEGVKNKSAELADFLTNKLGLSAEQATQVLKDMGFAAQESKDILAGFSQLSIDINVAPALQHLNDVQLAIIQTERLLAGLTTNLNISQADAQSVAGEDAALANAANAAASSGGASGVTGKIVVPKLPTLNTLGGGSPLTAGGATGGAAGGGGGSSAASAAKTAAANFVSAIQAVEKSITDAITSFGTETSAQVKSAFDSIDKAVAAAFKADKKTEPSSLVNLLQNDTNQLVALAKQRDALTASITSADSFAASTLTAAQGFGSLTTVAGTLAAFAKTTTDLSKLTLVLPGDPAALSGPAAQQAKVDALKKTLADRLALLQGFQANIQTIIHEGLNAGSVQDLIAGGVDANGNLAAALAQATPAQITALNANAAAVAATAKQLAANAGDAAAQAGIDAGKAVADGILQGLKDKNASLLQAMSSLADALVAQIKKDLKIKSPSQVMRGLGVHVGTGLEHGILSTHGAIATAAAGMARAARPSIASFDMPGGLGGAGSGFSPVSTTTHNNTREINAPVTIHAYGGNPQQIADHATRNIGKFLV